MSNRRRGQIRNTYRTGYLRSPAWFRRRDTWFHTTLRNGQPLICAACQQPGTPRTLELHHLTYQGIRVLDGRWLATERHGDLIPLHPGCHELLHRLIDRDRILSKHRTRRDATRIALEHLRIALRRGAAS